MSDHTQSTPSTTQAPSVERAAMDTMDRLTVSTHRGPYYGWVLMVVLGVTTIISYAHDMRNEMTTSEQHRA